MLSTREVARRVLSDTFDPGFEDSDSPCVDLTGARVITPSFFDEMLNVIDERWPEAIRRHGLEVVGIPTSLSDGYRAVARAHNLEVEVADDRWRLRAPPRAQEIASRLRLARDFQMNDLHRSIFAARTNFLTALGLVVYTEFWGHFLTGRKDPREAFDAFMCWGMGEPYASIVSQEKGRDSSLYDLLRNGLVHEYAPKRRPRFVIVGEDGPMTDDRIRRDRPAGLTVSDRDVIIVNSRYYVDLKSGVDRLIRESDEHHDTIERWFDQINFDSFR
ncbi:MAG: hypothetical protein EPO26_07775 [Chloroflexota bacterium]|nr:MAG: hypothetical protein EPO26_07775 [Chloroflexota bacterium]